jgi:hypothetical protein
MSARRRRKPMARRVTETERDRLETPVEPEDQPVAFYDPEEAFEIFDRPSQDGERAPAESLPLFEVAPFALVADGDAVHRDDDTTPGRSPERHEGSRRESLFGWLFARDPAREKRPRPAWDLDVPPTWPDGEAVGTNDSDAESQAAIGDIEPDDAETEASTAAALAAAALGADAEAGPRADAEAGPGAEAEDGPGADAEAGPGADAESPVAADVDVDATHAPDDDDEHHIKRVRKRRSSRAHRVRPVAAEELAGERAARKPSPLVGRMREVSLQFVKAALAVAAIIAVLLVALYALVLGVNALARWNAVRLANAATAAAPTANNLLVIGVKDGVATGFTALKAERSDNRVLGIAIPEGAFVEVPGQGFERIGASYTSGPGVSLDTVSNYLGVSFVRYAVVDGDTYQALLAGQDVAGLLAKATATNLTSKERASLSSYFATVKKTDVWIAPLPVKPVAVGDQQYFEPERAQVADLLFKWWGVTVSAQKSTPRVIVYNGVGTPGLAGLAAQQLIRSGFSVVNSGNAQNFAYKTTQILLYHGTQADAEAVRNSLGVGQIVVQSAPQDLTDMIVIIGSDYRPPISDASTATTQGAQ